MTFRYGYSLRHANQYRHLRYKGGGVAINGLTGKVRYGKPYAPQTNETTAETKPQITHLET